ncbi:translation initiation factor IF-2 associated domain-containing protein, partial [Mesorhizobium mediterraneum]|uniref:translation initiation factor IF-2 associated domain-containing protein n=1 Tax=Mesorhizobium mediterraneum TaxID=43617 RepID=UPI0017806DD6
MNDTKSGDDKTLSVTPKKTLTLKRPGTEQGTVRQSFSHGRTKAVVVETKKRKFSLPGDKPEPAAVFTPKAPVAAAPVVQEAPKAPPPLPPV